MMNTARSWMRRGFPWLLLASVLALWTWSGGGAHRAGLADGERAPELTVPWSEGADPFNLAHQEGRVVALAFWATWCPTCREEGPTLSRVYERLRGQGLTDTVVGVSIDGAPLEAIARAARGMGMTYPIARATRHDLERFRVDLLPTLYVVRADGIISSSFVGLASERDILSAMEDARRSVAGYGRPSPAQGISLPGFMIPDGSRHRFVASRIAIPRSPFSAVSHGAWSIPTP